MEKYISGKVKEEIRLELFLQREFGLTKRQVRQAKFREKGILVNGERCRVTEMVKPGDQVRVLTEEDCIQKILPENGELHILYEDEDLLVLNKPAGVVVHPSHGHYRDSILNQAAGYYDKKQENIKLRVIGRLDKDTSGVLVMAKNRIAAARLSGQKEQGIFRKEYLAITEKRPDPPCGIITFLLKKDPDSLMKMIPASEEEKGALPAHTAYYETEDPALVRVLIETGRTHQIRVHMAAIGCPLLGDSLYGKRDLRIGRAALHAWKTTLRQPFSGEELVFLAELPEDMEKCLCERKPL